MKGEEKKADCLELEDMRNEWYINEFSGFSFCLIPQTWSRRSQQPGNANVHRQKNGSNTSLISMFV